MADRPLQALIDLIVESQMPKLDRPDRQYLCVRSDPKSATVRGDEPRHGGSMPVNVDLPVAIGGSEICSGQHSAHQIGMIGIHACVEHGNRYAVAQAVCLRFGGVQVR